MVLHLSMAPRPGAREATRGLPPGGDSGQRRGPTASGLARHSPGRRRPRAPGPNVPGKDGGWRADVRSREHDELLNLADIERGLPAAGSPEGSHDEGRARPPGDRRGGPAVRGEASAGV
jgi:hypothetical protein